MGHRIFAVLMAGVLPLLSWPPGAAADHVVAYPQVGASLKGLTASSARIEVQWNVACTGDGSDPRFSGDLALEDVDTGEVIPMGGVSSGSGTAVQLVGRLDRDRRIQPKIKVNCAKSRPDNTLHGSDTVEATGEPVTVPRKGADTGGGGGNRGGGGGRADDPLGPGGCDSEILGSARPDVLRGGMRGDLILGFGGRDRIHGDDGHDCLIGGPGRDRLFGEGGRDRLTGGRGADRLAGGRGRNVYDAGPGNDRIRARNGVAETVRCGSGEDSARADARDRLLGCEHVR